MASLYIYPEEGVPRKEELETACASIGRARDNDIVLADPACSSHHAFFDRGDRGYLIRDTGSKNGTLVNDRGIKGPVALSEGDKIFLGSTTVFYDRPRMPPVKIIDSPAKEAESGTSIPFRAILDRTVATDEKTTSFVANLSVDQCVIMLRAELRHGTDLATLASNLNDFVHESSDIHTFITFFYGELDKETGGLRFVNAGHNPPLVLGRDGLVRDLPASGLSLGMLPGRPYEVGTAALGPGEILVLYTDGITESRNSGGEEFGAERLADVVRSERDKDAPAIVEAVFYGLAEFAGCGDPYDDRTLVIVKRAESAV